MANAKPLTQTTGRRKSSVARVRLYDGTGAYQLNERSLVDYFPDPELRRRVEEAFKVTETEGRFDVHASLHGGGTTGQSDALRLSDQIFHRDKITVALPIGVNEVVLLAAPPRLPTIDVR